ncbi:MAG: glycosyltransferase family 2 protein [Bacteroidetes bacterium]|nr:glycosyltransferase family 2 protein [Bacteroidota bacterium]
MNKQPYIIAQVLNMNGLELLKKCIPLLITQDYENLKIEIIDNGSNDGSIEFITNNYPQINIIKNNENIGLANARNIGFKSAINQNADYILTLDNDTLLVNSDTISHLVKRIRGFSDKSIFAFGVKILEGKDQLLVNDGQILFKKQSLKGKYFNKLRNKTALNYPETDFRYVDFVSGCFMMVNTGLLKATGLIDEKYYIYYEEADLCMRGWLKKFPSIVFPDIIVHHIKTATNINWSVFYTYYTIRNFALFTKTYLNNTSNKFYFSLLRYKKIGIYILSAVLHSLNKKRLPSVIKSITLAIADYKKKRFGKRY